MASSLPRNAHIANFLADPETQRSLALGDPDYGVGSVMVFLKDFFLDPSNSGGGEFQTAPLGAGSEGADAARYMQVIQQLDYDSVAPGQKPRIVVVDRGMSGSQAIGMADGLDSYDWLSGRTTRRYMGQSRIDIQCLASGMMTAGRLSWAVMMAFRAFAPQIRELLGWSSLRANGRIGPAPVFPGAGMSKPDLMMYAIPLSGILMQSFTVTPDAPKVGGVGIIVEDAQTESVIDKIRTGE